MEYSGHGHGDSGFVGDRLKLTRAEGGAGGSHHDTMMMMTMLTSGGSLSGAEPGG